MPLTPIQFFQDAAPVPGQQILTAWPVGSIYISVLPTNPATLFGFGTWVAFGTGRVLVAIDTGNPNFATVEQTGGALTVPAAGSNSAPAFTGTSANTSAVSAGTPSGTVSQPLLTMSAYTPTGSVAAPVFSGTPFSSVITHTHTIQMQGSATPATTGTHIVNSTATGGSSRISVAPDATNAPAGAVASITPAGTNSAPAFTGNAFTLTGVVSQPTFTGAPLTAHQHTLTPTGTVAAPTFTGTPTSVVQPYIVVYMWKRIA